MREMYRGNVVFRSLVVASVLVGLFAIFMVRPASAYATYKIEVVNNTDKNVWVTVYWSYEVKANWSIEDSFCLRPQQRRRSTVDFKHDALVPELKFRAEAKSESGCSGQTLVDKYSSKATGFQHLLQTHKVLYANFDKTGPDRTPEPRPTPWIPGRVPPHPVHLTNYNWRLVSGY